MLKPLYWDFRFRKFTSPFTYWNPKVELIQNSGSVKLLRNSLKLSRKTTFTKIPLENTEYTFYYHYYRTYHNIGTSENILTSLLIQLLQIANMTRLT